MTSLRMIALKQKFVCQSVGDLRRAIDGLTDDTPIECDFQVKLSLWRASRVSEILKPEIAKQLPTDLLVAYDYGDDADDSTPIFLGRGCTGETMEEANEIASY